MDKHTATVTFHFPDLKQQLSDVKDKISAVINSKEFAEKFEHDYPANATARGVPLKTTLTISGTASDTAGKAGGGATVSVGFTWG
jgi:hypothetical protein